MNKLRAKPPRRRPLRVGLVPLLNELSDTEAVLRKASRPAAFTLSTWVAVWRRAEYKEAAKMRRLAAQINAEENPINAEAKV